MQAQLDSSWIPPNRFFPIQLAHENCLELQMDALPLALNIDGVEDNADHLGPAAEAGNSKNA